MIGLQLGTIKPQFTILSIYFTITTNKNFLIKTNDVNVEIFEDCSFKVHHWHHHL
jgi:hypothetical protein